MELKPIRSEEEYEKALQRLDELFDSEPGTKEGDELEAIAERGKIVIKRKK
jgi:HTH-type transcriptional regulator/antitoxin HigA